MSKQIAICIDTPALGDTLAAIPTLRKLSKAYESQLIVFSSKPFLFEGHPLVSKALKLDDPLRFDPNVKVYRTFMPIVGKAYDLKGEQVEFRSSNMDIRQFHAVSLGFTLSEDEMEMDLYIEKERELGFEDYVIIHPTHTWPTRTWDQSKWQELVDRLNEQGIPVVAVGRDSHEVGTFSVDKPVMNLNIKLGVNLLNDDSNDPAELRWMMNHKARAVVTMDSGILHIAGTTDVNIIQLGSSIDPKLRAPYRKGTQDYKYTYVGGGCDIFCSSNMKYNIKEHGTIQAIPPQIYCLENKPTFECHPTVDATFNEVIKLYDNLPLITENMPNKKKLLFLAPHLSTGGMPQFLLQRVEAMLTDSNYEIYLIEYTQYSNVYNVQRDQLLEKLGDKFYSLGFLNSIDITERGQRLKDKIEAINPDIIHIDECPESFDGFNKLDDNVMDWLYNKRWKVVETSHNIWFDPANKVNDPDMYMMCTPYHLETFSNRNGLKPVIEYPIIDKRPSTLDIARCRSKLGFGIDKIHILNVGLWTQGKNQAEGINIARIVEASHPGQFHFHFVGNQAENFEHYWGPLMKNLPTNVTIWGERTDVDVFMSACDAFMFNSTWECSPLALREAIGHGLITFARDLEQYKDMFTPYIVPFTNDLHENVDQLIRTLKSSEVQGKNIPQDDFKRFTQQHIEWYQRVLEAPRSPQLPPQPKQPKWRFDYVDGPRLTIETTGTESLRAEFWDGQDLVYAPENLKQGHWYQPARHWWTEWTIKIWSGDQLVHTEQLTLEGQELTVEMASSSLGDTLSFMGQLHTVIDTHKLSRLYVKTHKPWLFDHKWYRAHGVHIIGWDQPTVGALIRLGVFYTMEEPWKRSEHKYDWRQVPLGKIASDRLGVPYKEQRPQLAPEYYAQGPHNARTRSVVIATQSTAQAKYWNNPTGWQEVIDWCNQNNIKVSHASKEGTKLKGIEQLPEELSLVAMAINEADCFIGISSGLSWFAWALGKKVILISGFTDPYVEFEDAIYINNHQVCHGCWGWSTFDKGDWNWCPAWKGTQRQFECSRNISSDQVIEAIMKQMYG